MNSFFMLDIMVSTLFFVFSPGIHGCLYQIWRSIQVLLRCKRTTDRLIAWHRHPTHNYPTGCVWLVFGATITRMTNISLHLFDILSHTAWCGWLGFQSNVCDCSPTVIVWRVNLLSHDAEFVRDLTIEKRWNGQGCSEYSFCREMY